MACETILGELKALVNQVGDSCSDPSPCCAPCNPPSLPATWFPYAQVTMTCPPPIMPPTRPEPVKPLQLPAPCPQYTTPTVSPEQYERHHYDNYYNNYNVDHHCENPAVQKRVRECCPPQKQKNERWCEDYTKRKIECPDPGCPTGFKPCEMKLTPPPCCDPRGVWIAQVQPCPPKPKKKDNNMYVPGPCTRPCCKHWRPKEGPCLYDDPCKADCFNHPPGMKPSGRFP